MQYQKNLTLRDGTPCVLRNAGADDAEQVLRIFNLTHTQTEFLLTYPGESPMTVENERDFLAQSAAEFGISIDRAYWGRGIGRALTEACIECAKTAGYTQLELDVVAENTAARMLYEHVGFTEYGRNPRGFHTRSGAWQELILMRLELD